MVTLFKLLSIVIAMALCSSNSTIVAQNISGTILGTVTDASGGVLVGVEVTVTNQDTNQAFKATTNELGHYQAPYLKPGPYQLEVSMQGFKKSTRKDVVLKVEDRLRLDFKLEVGELTETLTVSEQSPLLQADSASLGVVVTTKSIEELPLRGRNVFDLVLLSPGTLMSPRQVGRVGAYSSFPMADISINGGRFRTNEFILDGISIMLPENNNYALSPTPDGTQEFKVHTNSYGAQFGRTGGGVINVVTKGGSNELHGSVYEFFRNDWLSANNFFANMRGQPRGVFHFNMFGAAAGGPIIKNKTFFFGEYQGHRQRSALGSGATTLPTEAMRRGDFSGLRNSSGAAVTIYDPFTTRPGPGGVGFIRDPFPNNRVPTERIDRVASQVLKFLPLPNTTGEGPARFNNYLFQQKSFANSDLWSARIDQRFSERFSLFGRVTRSVADEGSTGEFGTLADTTTGPTNNRVINAVLNSTHVLNPTRILNWRLGFTRRFELRGSGYPGQADLAALGFPPNVVAAADTPHKMPQFSVAGYGAAAVTGGASNFIGPPGGEDIRRGNDIYTLVAEQTEIHGRHTLIFGGDFRLYNQTPYQSGGPGGTYSFSRSQTGGPNPLVASLTDGDGFASFLTGFGSGSISQFARLAMRNYYAGLFVNDDIKLNRLTVSLGLRYDYESPWTERYDRLANFDFDSPFPVQIPSLPNLRGVLTKAGQGGVPRGQWDPARKNFGPRIGLAYRLTNQMAVRAGYGIVYAPRISSTDSNSIGAAGANVSTTWVSSVDGVTPLNLLSNPYPTGLFLPPVTEAERLLVGEFLPVTARHNKNNNYSQFWNLSVQREFAGNWLVEAAYSGSRGIRNTIAWDYNQMDPRYQSLGPALSQQVPNPFFGLVRTGFLAQPTVARSQLLRPFPQYPNIRTNWHNGSASTYHSMQLKGREAFFWWVQRHGLLYGREGDRRLLRAPVRILRVPPADPEFLLPAL